MDGLLLDLGTINLHVEVKPGDVRRRGFSVWHPFDVLHAVFHYSMTQFRTSFLGARRDSRRRTSDASVAPPSPPPTPTAPDSEACKAKPVASTHEETKMIRVCRISGRIGWLNRGLHDTPF
jgi:hypothetical protein